MVAQTNREIERPQRRTDRPLTIKTDRKHYEQAMELTFWVIEVTVLLQKVKLRHGFPPGVDVKVNPETKVRGSCHVTGYTGRDDANTRCE